MLAAVVAVGQWRAAAAEALRAKRRVDTTTLEKLETVLDSRDRRRASDVLADAVAAHRAAYGAAAATPLELAILHSAIDRSLATCSGHEAEVTAVAFSPDGTRLATGSDDTTARLWNVATGEELALCADHALPITSLAFAPDGTRLATGSRDKTARVWEASSGASLAVLAGHAGPVSSLAFALTAAVWRRAPTTAPHASGARTHLGPVQRRDPRKPLRSYDSPCPGALQRPIAIGADRDRPRHAAAGGGGRGARLSDGDR
jgi:dipeptidyl aminopeptidase/acylaminoacyl peptidase